MSDPRVLELLEEILESGRTPEEVCADSPELLWEVKERLRQCLRADAELDAMFPPNRTGYDEPSGATDQSRELPQIPGYEVESVLGRGGMGAVYKARQLKLNRTVALKTLLAGVYAREPELARFVREAQAVASLRHAHVVQVYDAGEASGLPYFAMEYVEGGSLAQKLAGTPQPGRDAAALVMTLARAMQAAHEAGIVHRDLKPSNILLTADGTPKVSDFGLARHFEGEDALTLSGARLGTPSYMSPEQASGKADAVGPPADVYALGAILYEALTGRPPFRGESSADTERQVITQEPVPPSRLNPKVPRDLETICLKCLQKDPQRRYASAAALADDLQRFGRGEPIVARRAGRVERLVKWVRRRPAAAAAVGTGAILAAVLVGAASWVITDRAATAKALEDDLREIARHQQRSAWHEAGAAVQRARGRFGGRVSPDLRSRVEQAARELALVARLDAIRMAIALPPPGTDPMERADREYAAAFAEAGLGTVNDEPGAVAARIKASGVRAALVTALDDWATTTRRHDWVLAVVHQADPDASSWATRLRQPSTWNDRTALAELTERAPIETASPSLLTVAGALLEATGGDAIPYFRRVQRAHPADYWVNYKLAYALGTKGEHADAARYFQAALSVRPTAPAYFNLGVVLASQRRLDEAVEYFGRTVELEPSFLKGQTHLGRAFAQLGRHDEALVPFEQAIRLAPEDAEVRLMYARSLDATGRLADAEAEYRRALAINPQLNAAQDGLRGIQIALRPPEELREPWRRELEAAPHGYDAWHGYAELCLLAGNQDDYIRTRRILLERFGATDDPLVAGRSGIACLLLPATGEELRAASALAERAATARSMAPAPKHPHLVLAKALSEYRHGRWDAALAIAEGEARGALEPAPVLLAAMAHHRAGRAEESRQTLAAALLSFDWVHRDSRDRDAWTRHVLRREAEAMILPELPAFLAGKFWPKGNVEKLALLGVCQSRGLHLYTARLWAEALAANPQLGEDPRSHVRFRAASAAAVVGGGRSADSATLGSAERARWRTQALAWLRAELSAWEKLALADARLAPQMQESLAKWRHHPDLGGVRNAALDLLPADETREWITLWSDLATAVDGSRGRNE